MRTAGRCPAGIRRVRSTRPSVRGGLALLGVVVIALSCGITASVRALGPAPGSRAGDLDPSFGVGGSTEVDFPGGQDRASAVVADELGRVVVAGVSNGDFALARYDLHGSLDASFGVGGLVTTDFSGDAAVAALVIQPDGGILAAGCADCGTPARVAALARYRPDGALDTTFGAAGRVVTALGRYVGAVDIALQLDGKLVIAGASGTGPSDFVVARYLPGGALDPGFGDGGSVDVDLGGFEVATGIAVQPDGRIIAAGSATIEGIADDDFAVVRLEASGSPDPTFGAGGRVITDFGGSDRPYDVAVQGSDIVVAGQTGTAGGLDFAAARYNSVGTLDETFASSGTARLDFGQDDVARTLILQPDGGVVLAGESGDPNDELGRVFALARLTVRGLPDPAFGNGGRVTTSFDRGAVAAGSASLPDGMTVAAGSAAHAAGSDMALARYTGVGLLDGDFGVAGRVTTDFGRGGQDAARDVVIQPDRKIIVVGEANRIDFGLARFTASGRPDPTFGTHGRVVTDLGGSEYAYSVVLQPDGRIVVAGEGGPSEDFVLARYEADGSLDRSFGEGGIVRTDFGGRDSALGLVIQRDGKLVAVGCADCGVLSGDIALARYDAAGVLDPAFDGDGRVRTDLGGTIDAAAAAVALPDGGIAVAGVAMGPSGEGSDFAVVRYMPTGLVDTGFGSGGIVITDFGGNDWASDLTVQPDGRLVVVGSAAQSFFFSPDLVGMARYNRDGSIDAGFGLGGKVMEPFGSVGGSAATSVLLQPDGHLVVVGYTNFSAGDFVVGRFDRDGVLDAGFGSGGKVTTDFGGREGALGAALSPDGRIIAVGVSRDDFRVARYVPRPSADLAVTTSVAASPARSGRELTYSITVSNVGSSPATGVVLRDVLGGDVRILRTDAGCVQTASVVTCRAPALAGGASLTYRITVRPMRPWGVVHNRAEVSEAELELTPDDNLAAVATTLVRGRPKGTAPNPAGRSGEREGAPVVLR